METFFSGAWRNPKRGEILTGGAWRRLTRAEVYIGGQWKKAVTFVPPLSLLVPSTATGERRANKPSTGLVTTDYIAATPVGGSAPFTYNWVVLGADASITNPTQAVTAFTRTLGPDRDAYSYARVTCTDSLGSVVTGDVELYFSNFSDFA